MSSFGTLFTYDTCAVNGTKAVYTGVQMSQRLNHFLGPGLSPITFTAEVDFATGTLVVTTFTLSFDGYAKDSEGVYACIKGYNTESTTSYTFALSKATESADPQ